MASTIPRADCSLKRKPAAAAYNRALVSALQVLAVPSGPPLAELAAAAPDARWPMLLDSGPLPSPWARLSLFLLDPVETVVSKAQPGGHTLRDVQRALDRRWSRAT